MRSINPWNHYNMQVFSHLPILVSGIIVGMIMMQVAIIAPAVFTTFSPKDAGPFLRNVFPKLFLSVLILAICSSIFTYFLGNGEKISLAASLITAIAMTACYLMVPATNAAKDSKNERLFKRLHSASVFLTVIALISNLSWSFL